MKHFKLILWILLGLFIALALFYKFIFLRDNDNLIPAGNNMVSPASGKIISIQEIDKNSDISIRKGFFGKIFTTNNENQKYTLINIFMTPFNVHYQKMPLTGKIREIIHQPGRFVSVNSIRAALVNEKQEFLLDTKVGLVKVIQIAGFLARRNKALAKVNDELQKGDRIGQILLGSQVALLLPIDACSELKVKVGDKVSSGETVICDL